MDTHLISPCKNVTNQDLAYLNYRHMLRSGGVRIFSLRQGRGHLPLHLQNNFFLYLQINNGSLAFISCFSLFLLFNDAPSRQSQD
jgi:hypothetical protein